MARRHKNFVSKKTARSILKALIAPADLRSLEFLRVVLVAGFPGSGKSTVAQLLHTCYGFELFSTDQVRVEELFTDQKHRLGKEHDRVMISRYLVYEELARRVGKALSMGKRVVVDGTHLDDKRLMILGSILGQVPAAQVAFVILKPPEWIMRRRFQERGLRQANNWWSVYKYWRKYMKEGKAAFPTDALFPQVKRIFVRRYAIRTFNWVPDIKAVVWDVDGTLYKDVPPLRQKFDAYLIDECARLLKRPKKQVAKKFWELYEKYGGKTKTVEAMGLNGRRVVSSVATRMPYHTVLKKDKKLERMFKALRHLPHYILTNSGKIETATKLKALGISPDWFEAIWPAYETPYLKPDSRLFTWLARKVGYRPKRILYVGDKEIADVIPAKEVGMRTCYVWGVSREADVSVPTVYEVAEVFGREI